MSLPPRESGKFIAENAKDVRIEREGVRDVVKMIGASVEKGEFSLATWKTHKLHPKEANGRAIDWIFLVDTLNFSFWTEDNRPKYLVDFDGELHGGYWALCAAINRAQTDGIPICDASYYSKMTSVDVSRIFKSATPTEIPLLEERKRVLNETGAILLQKYGGTFVNCVEEAKGSTKRLLQILVENFPSYRDEATYEGVRVSLYKRAQIVIADIWSCFEGRGLGAFRDVEYLTAFPDYRVPQVLVYTGAMTYSTDLLQKLRNGEILQNGSREEIEIRGSTIWAVELVKEELGKRETKLNSILIDFYLWDYRRIHCEELERIPYHKTRSIFY